MNNIYSQNSNHKLLKITLIIFLLALLYGLTAYFTKIWPFTAMHSNTSSSNNTPVSSQSDIDKHKDDFNSQQKSDSSTPASPAQSVATVSKKAATVTITDAAQYDNTVEVRSYIGDAYEDGTCTITFKKDALTITRQTPAYRDATTTICTNPLIERSSFTSAGDWSVTVTYESPSYKGTSPPQTVAVK